MRTYNLYHIKPANAPLTEAYQYTIKEMAQFALFCKRHGFTFGNPTEYRAALKQFYSEV